MKQIITKKDNARIALWQMEQERQANESIKWHKELERRAKEGEKLSDFEKYELERYQAEQKQ